MGAGRQMRGNRGTHRGNTLGNTTCQALNDSQPHPVMVQLSEVEIRELRPKYLVKVTSD